MQLARMWEPVVAQRASWAVQGSAASSLVLFGIGMLPFCPADHGLLFDRFRIAFRGRPWELDVIVSPEVMAIVREFRRRQTPRPGRESPLGSPSTRSSKGTFTGRPCTRRSTHRHQSRFSRSSPDSSPTLPRTSTSLTRCGR